MASALLGPRIDPACATATFTVIPSIGVSRLMKDFGSKPIWKAGISALTLAILLAACAGKAETGPEHALKHSESEMTGWNGVDLEKADPGQVAAGRGIAERECASCHAIDRTSASPNKAAPPLRDVLALYDDSEQLAYRFIDAMRVGHDEMPLFDFDVRATDALIAYIKSVTAPKD